MVNGASITNHIASTDVLQQRSWFLCDPVWRPDMLHSCWPRANLDKGPDTRVADVAARIVRHQGLTGMALVGMIVSLTN